ncbi:hypothetical protein NEUTE1DRAFT_97590 [Neurospora tetrasperma FGSC 2508]|uniref:Uncharacterized protein n=1 Tax=Neurospora tetrasperma (strain FGSC 2508 / ATCC MYA-4615 / P0657) TaxID=510951 RepID=F8MCB9_NEUT8|nr:uncharacterized protein NEUTE1DRAFT_97590 [Neurospora tetrasperma FGSC 2508]EGO60420.1 hypothetical protein NEUTE1DRAFT_97590 [Neurospora tetrasperma FGSC 2508]EGZ75603.1 hypothetical protein NEUTE2DRAFT_126559 [Neurospora tetrasperma FGSC 2509]
MAPSILETLALLLSASAAFLTTGAGANPLPNPSSNSGAKAKSCVNGPPATDSSPGSLPIADYSLVAPAANLNWTSYTVKKSWWDKHFLSGPHKSELTNMDQIQNSTCPTPTTPTPTAHSSASTLATRRVINARVTFCGTVPDINNANEHINCVLFDDIIDPSIFVLGGNSTIGAGGYDRRCQSSTA